ncbi:MAG: hypothetical protein ACHQHN_17250 [Sphingobacteriales bacterium]
MDDQLDNDLKNRIKEVFDNYEDTSADKGWLQLRKKYPEKAKRIIAAWMYWAPAAALVLLFLGMLWFKTTPKQQQGVGIAKTLPVHPIIKNPEEKKNTAVDSSAIRQNGQAIAHNTQATAAATTPAKHSAIPAIQPKTAQKVYTFTPQRNAVPATVKSTVGTSQSVAAQINTTAQAKVQNGVTSIDKIASATTATTKSPAITPSNPGNEVIAKIDSGGRSTIKSNVGKPAPEAGLIAQQPNKSNRQAFADNNNGYEKQKSLSKIKSVSFAVYTTTYINYAKGSNHQFNVGGGLTSDIKLTNHLLVSTGISVTQNSLNYVGQLPAASPAANTLSDTYAPASLTASRYAFTSNSAPPAFRNYSASLVGLDIPLNLKFVIDPQKTGTYFLAGLSSGTYINETYTYSYKNPSLFSANVSQIQDQSTRSSFNGFYFAKTLNVALGTSYMIGHSHLVIEPFLKYPLEGLGSQQLRFGSSGVNLKFNFNGFKR